MRSRQLKNKKNKILFLILIGGIILIGYVKFNDIDFVLSKRFSKEINGIITEILKNENLYPIEVTTDIMIRKNKYNKSAHYSIDMEEAFNIYIYIIFENLLQKEICYNVNIWVC